MRAVRCQAKNGQYSTKGTPRPTAVDQGASSLAHPTPPGHMAERVGSTEMNRPMAGEELQPGSVTLVTADGTVREVAGGFAFPNGTAVTPRTARRSPWRTRDVRRRSRRQPVRAAGVGAPGRRSAGRHLRLRRRGEGGVIRRRAEPTVRAGRGACRSAGNETDQPTRLPRRASPGKQARTTGQTARASRRDPDGRLRRCSWRVTVRSDAFDDVLGDRRSEPADRPRASPEPGLRTACRRLPPDPGTADSARAPITVRTVNSCGQLADKKGSCPQLLSMHYDSDAV